MPENWRSAHARERRTRGLGGLAIALAVMGVLLAVGKADPASLHHIHGLAVDPGDAATVYIATHAGLVNGTQDKDWQFVGDDRSDFMGFTVHPTVPGRPTVAAPHPPRPAGPEPVKRFLPFLSVVNFGHF